MSSFIKSNKTLLSRIKAKIIKGYRTDYRAYSFSLSVLVDVDGDISKYYFDATVEFSLKDMKWVEDKNKIYLCIDLSTSRFNRSCQDYEEGVAFWVRELAYPYMENYARPKVLKRCQDEGYTKESFNRYMTCKNNSIVKETLEKVNALLEKTPTLTLKDGEWPRLSNRSVLPILVIDKETLNVDFYKERYFYPKTYREGREVSPMDYFTSRNSSDFVLLCDAKIPFSLVDISI